ncbi:glycine cleavage T C-terminal barrel domain-containing protein [Mesorhizobium sp. LSJC285A00]|uniref:glycine cleavage T C-terminal barrel domain-containing protein n=1 Tax=Mesorhizobium sp. LSJC285A00 TaxID=1287338 RepID=UPI001FD8F3AC|nr:glycine cleavage T C-terminal barrel domain-containing protein [Mesorhizobium sp. LSJC285A00]
MLPFQPGSQGQRGHTARFVERRPDRDAGGRRRRCRRHGFEPVWHKGRRVGFVASAGYGYTIGKSVALTLLGDEFAGEGTALWVHIVGVERPARIIPASPYDPEGRRCGNEEFWPWSMTL